jgi:hypothetical protein
MLKPIHRVRLRKASGKYSVGIPKEIAEQIKSSVLELTVENGKIQIAEA